MCIENNPETNKGLIVPKASDGSITEFGDGTYAIFNGPEIQFVVLDQDTVIEEPEAPQNPMSSCVATNFKII